MANLKTPVATLSRGLAKARTPRQRAAAIARVLHVATYRRSASGSARLAAVLPLAGVQTAAQAKWQARAATLATFLTWCVDQDNWAASVDRAFLAYLPANLWPSRMAAAARRWAVGTGGTAPALLTARWNKAKAATLAKTIIYDPPTPIVHSLFATRADGMNPNWAGEPYAFQLRSGHEYELRA